MIFNLFVYTQLFWGFSCGASLTQRREAVVFHGWHLRCSIYRRKMQVSNSPLNGKKRLETENIDVAKSSDSAILKFNDSQVESQPQDNRDKPEDELQLSVGGLTRSK